LKADLLADLHDEQYGEGADRSPTQSDLQKGILSSGREQDVGSQGERPGKLMVNAKVRSRTTKRLKLCR
jgi:hypothetical protein